MLEAQVWFLPIRSCLLCTFAVNQSGQNWTTGNCQQLHERVNSVPLTNNYQSAVPAAPDEMTETPLLPKPVWTAAKTVNQYSGLCRYYLSTGLRKMDAWESHNYDKSTPLLWQVTPSLFFSLSLPPFPSFCRLSLTNVCGTAPSNHSHPRAFILIGQSIFASVRMAR